MDEQKGMDGSGEVVGGDTLVEHAGCEGQGQGEGSSHGEDIMVEVLGSDVFVDGVCAHGEVGSGREVKSSGHEGIGDLSDDVPNIGTESVVVTVTEEVVVVVREEALEGVERGREIVGGSEDDGVGDIARKEVGVLSDEAQIVELRTGADGSLTVMVPMGGETKDVILEEVKVVEEEDGSEGGLVKKSVERGSEMKESVLIEVMSLDKVEVLYDDVHNPQLEYGARGSSPIIDSFHREKEITGAESEPGLRRQFSKEGVEDDKKLIDVGDACEDTKREEVDGVEDNTWNPGIATEGGCSSTVEESLPGLDKNVSVVISKDEVLKPRDVSSGSDDLKELVSSPERSHLVDRTDSVGTEKDDVANSNPSLLDEQTQDAAGGEVAVTDSEKCHSVDDMDTEAYDQNTKCSFDKMQENVEIVDGHGIVVAAVDEKIILKDQPLKLEECLDKSMTVDLAPVTSSMEEQCEVEKGITDSENVGSLGGQELEVEEKQLKIETDGSEVDNFEVNNYNITVETISEGEKIDCMVTEIGEMDSKEAFNSNIEYLGSAEKVRQLKSEDCVEKGVPYVLVQVDLDVQKMEVEEQVTDAEQIGVYESQEITIEENASNISSGQEIPIAQRSSSHKRKHNLKDIIYSRKKERSSSELMDEAMEYQDDENESDGIDISQLVSSSPNNDHKAVDSLADDSVTQVGTKSISLAKVSHSMPFPKPSFKIGDCIRRVASQLTGSPSILKCNSENSEESGRMTVPSGYSSLDDLLSQLHSAAQDPTEGYSFLNIIISFFSDFRNSIIFQQHSAMDKVGGRRKRSSAESPETFEFEDMNDSYWTDMVVQNGAEEQLSHVNTQASFQLVPIEPEKPPPASRRTHSRKRYRGDNFDPVTDKTTHVDEKKRALSPAELILNFPDFHSVPSELNLNKIFKRFGPLKESETEIDRLTSRARVVFKKGSDAEVAFSSSKKFNIFGSTHVNYQLSYSPSLLFKASLIATPDSDEDAI